MPLTLKSLGELPWTQIYFYEREDQRVWFKTFDSGKKGLTITHNKRLGVKQVQIYYTVHGRKTDSPSQAIKWYNAAEVKAKQA